MLAVLATVFYYYMVKQYYVEQSIFEFRQSKHEIMLYMADNAVKLDEKELKDLKDLYKSVNHTIEMFLLLKGMRFSTIKTIINNTVSSSIKIDSERALFYKKHESVLKHYIYGIHMSLKAIPLLKLRAIIHLIKLLCKFLILLGIEKGRLYLQHFESFVVAENTNFNDRCLG